MCTVVGYIGKSFCSTYIFEGLARLQYRGYDSAGFACLEPKNQKLLYTKASGQLIHLTERLKKNPIDGFLGIGHTRWATHGDFSENNAHPHFDCSKTISVVHNGIIENYDILKEQLSQAGHVFSSETDTEVIGHLFEVILFASEITLIDSVCDILQNLRGMYAFIVMLECLPESLILVRNKSPLCVGVGNGEMFIASDISAFAGKTDKVFFMPDASFAFITKDAIKAYDFAGQEIAITIETKDFGFEQFDRGDYEHFMLKEIYEQKTAISNGVQSLRQISLFEQLGLTSLAIKQIEKICIVACGTSWHAARIAQFFFESIVQVPVTVFLASEFRYMSFFSEKNTFYMVISQSGETADTLEALRLINAHGLPTIALTNVATSTVAREAGGVLLTCAGPEIAVASTKAFSTQIAALYWFAHRIAVEKQLIPADELVQAEENLLTVAQILQDTIDQYKNEIDCIHAKNYAQYDKALFLGRHSSYPLALEAALKLKEVAYVFAQGYPAGELKHGALALVDNKMPVYILSHQDPVIYQKLLSNAHEVKARGGRVIAFAYAHQNELCALAEISFVVTQNVPPQLGSLAMIGMIQYFVYTVAKERGCPIDKPRNLAKSVTVE